MYEMEQSMLWREEYKNETPPPCSRTLSPLPLRTPSVYRKTHNTHPHLTASIAAHTSTSTSSSNLQHFFTMPSPTSTNFFPERIHHTQTAPYYTHQSPDPRQQPRPVFPARQTGLEFTHYGRHSSKWLFNGFSVRETVRSVVTGRSH